MALMHGGDTVGFFLEYGYEPLDFSANCNPLGAPEGVKEAIRLTTDQIDAYPDPLCRFLCSALAEHEGVLPENILCGNGSADLIDRLTAARNPGKAIVTDPTFAEYERALRSSGCEVIHHSLSAKEGFIVTESILASLSPDIDMLFLCNPNNPTGLTISQHLLNDIFDACVRSDILLVLDECFNGFLDDPKSHSLISRTQESGNLLILKAFTKLYGMAGVRLGYCVSSDKKLLQDMMRAGQPWAVSSLAQAAGLAALGEQDYLLASRELVRKERAYLSEALKELGMHVTESEANYIFFFSDFPDLAGKMRERGVLIRSCSSYPGLTDGYYRIAVRTHDQNLRLIEAMTACVKEFK